MFWKKLAHLILNNRITFLVVTGLLTVFMGYKASQVRITFAGSKVLPLTDSAYIKYNEFKKIFGQDASTMVVGFRSPGIFTKNVINDWFATGEEIRKIKGITTVISVANLFDLQKDTTNHRFILKPLMSNAFDSQQQ